MPTFGAPFGSPFYSGGGGSALVPSRYHLGIAGMPFLLDLKREADFGWGDIPIQRPQADTSGDPGQQSLSTSGLWRRTVESWHHGAGQSHLDRREGDPFRFLSSQGVDPWTKYRLSPLPTTEDTGGPTDPIALLVANQRLYALSSSAPYLSYTEDFATWTTVTGLHANQPTSMTTDGAYIYVAQGTAGITRHDVTTDVATASWVTGTISRVGYVRGRLMAAHNNVLYNYTGSGGAIGAALSTNSNPGFVWEGFAEGPGFVYVFGGARLSKSFIYRITIKPDGTGLDQPIAAAPVFTDEYVWVMREHGGLAILGTDKGWRPALVTDSGDLLLGSPVPLNDPVYALEIAGRFAFFGWTDFEDDETYTGLGRADLSTDTAAGTTRDGSVPVPAYAADIYAPAGVLGTITAVADFQGRRVFAVEGWGVYAESLEEKVASGVIDLGLIGWGIGDLKNGLFADVRHLPLTAGQSVTVEVAKDTGPHVTAGSSVTVGSVSASIQLGQVLAEVIGIRVTLTGGATLTEVTLQAAPAPEMGEMYHLPLRMFQQDTDVNGRPVQTDVPAMLAFLRALRRTKEAVNVQLGSEGFTGIIEHLRAFAPEGMALRPDSSWLGYWNGVQNIVVKRVKS